MRPRPCPRWPVPSNKTSGADEDSTWPAGDRGRSVTVAGRVSVAACHRRAFGMNRRDRRRLCADIVDTRPSPGVFVPDPRPTHAPGCGTRQVAAPRPRLPRHVPRAGDRGGRVSVAACHRRAFGMNRRDRRRLCADIVDTRPSPGVFVPDPRPTHAPGCGTRQVAARARLPRHVSARARLPRHVTRARLPRQVGRRGSHPRTAGSSHTAMVRSSRSCAARQRR